MKKWLFVAAAIISVVLSGCCGGTTQSKDAKSVFETWLDAAKAIESMRADYNLVIEGCSKGSTQCSEVDIQGTLYVKGNQRLDESELTINGSRQQIKQYSFEDKVYVAIMVEGKWVTREVALSIYFNSDEDQAEIESLYQRGALVVGNTVEPKSISGEECDCVTLSAQLSKLSIVDKKFLLFSGGLSTMSNVDSYLDAIKSYSAKFCLLSNGMVLESETNLEFTADALPPDGVISSHILSTITDYEINPIIPDSFFDLP
jgi:outer membrane lipoprotein-sorting protein